jgi:hypothetical protein
VTVEAEVGKFLLKPELGELAGVLEGNALAFEFPKMKQAI